MPEKVKLWKYSFEELLDGYKYKGNKTKNLRFESNDYDTITLEFGDYAQLSINYSPGSLMMVSLSENNDVKRRLIPDGKPRYDKHYDDVMSFATTSDFVSRGKEFDVWEPFSQKSLEELLGHYCKEGILDSIEPTFGLQNWLTIKLVLDQIASSCVIEIGFKFPKDAIHSAQYVGNSREILYLP